MLSNLTTLIYRLHSDLLREFKGLQVHSPNFHGLIHLRGAHAGVRFGTCTDLENFDGNRGRPPPESDAACHTWMEMAR
jgi:hypothetical protein